MDLETLAIAHQKTEDRSLRNEGRIAKLEDEHAAIHQIATAVAVMAEKMDTMNTNLADMRTEVEEIKNKPAKRWDSLAGNLISVLSGAFLAWLVSGAAGI